MRKFSISAWRRMCLILKAVTSAWSASPSRYPARRAKWRRGRLSSASRPTRYWPNSDLPRTRSTHYDWPRSYRKMSFHRHQSMQWTAGPQQLLSLCYDHSQMVGVRYSFRHNGGEHTSNASDFVRIDRLPKRFDPLPHGGHWQFAGAGGHNTGDADIPKRLPVRKKYFVQSLSRPHSGEDDFNIQSRLEPGEPDHAFGKVGDFDRLPHI